MPYPQGHPFAMPSFTSFLNYQCIIGPRNTDPSSLSGWVANSSSSSLILTLRGIYWLSMALCSLPANGILLKIKLSSVVGLSLHLCTEKCGKFLNPPSTKASFHCFLCRKHHRRLAMQVLNPKAIKSFTSEIEYESHILIKSLYEQGKSGEFPINPAHYTGRFALKLVSSICCTMHLKLT